MENTSSYHCNFDELTNLFNRKSESLLLLESPMGKGTVQVFPLARGLEARFWNCSFNYQIELHGEKALQTRSRHYTLLCFLDTNGFTLSHADTFLHKNIVWNTAFLSENCACKMQIAPRISGRCLSISFSAAWFRCNLHSIEKGEIPQKLNQLESFSLVGKLHAAEMKIVQELMDLSWKKSFGTFYIKTLILKLLSDVMYRVKQRESFSINHLCLQTRVPEIEKYLK